MAISLSRLDELTHLYDHIMSRENVFLYGSTGIGKTFLSNLLIDKLQGRRVCFYRSLRGILSPQQYLEEFVREISRVARNHSNLDYQLKRFLDENPIYRFNSMNELDNWFQNLATTLAQIGLDFLFIFDDLHEWETDNDLDAVLQHLQTLNLGNNCQLLVVSNRDTSQNIKESKFSPYYLSSVKKEIIWPDGNEEWQEKAYQFTNGNTAFLLELLEYAEKDNHEIDQSIFRLMHDYHPVLGKIKARFTNLQWKLLRSIAFEEIVEQPHSFDFLVHHKLGAASSVERALRNLHDTQMVVKTEAGWKLSNIIYQRWLQWLYSTQAKY